MRLCCDICACFSTSLYLKSKRVVDSVSLFLLHRRIFSCYIASYYHWQTIIDELSRNLEIWNIDRLEEREFPRAKDQIYKYNKDHLFIRKFNTKEWLIILRISRVSRHLPLEKGNGQSSTFSSRDYPSVPVVLTWKKTRKDVYTYIYRAQRNLRRWLDNRRFIYTQRAGSR